MTDIFEKIHDTAETAIAKGQRPDEWRVGHYAKLAITASLPARTMNAAPASMLGFPVHSSDHISERTVMLMSKGKIVGLFEVD